MSISSVSDFFKARRYERLLQPGLAQVDGMIEAQVMAFDPGLSEYMEYICRTSGKRLRPILALLAGGACGGEPTDEHVRLGTILELIHMSTLVHDDVIDEAATRRGVQTPNDKWGNGMAVLLGDVLFSHSMLMSTTFDSILICRELGQAAKDVCEGEVLQSKRRFDYTLTQSEYFTIVEKKTAALFAAAAAVGARLSGKDESVVRAMHRYGVLLGTAYQVYDDCLDIVGTEEEAGKTLHTDAESGKLTLPMLYMLEGGCRGFQHRMVTAIQEKKPFDFPVKDTTIAIARCVTLGLELTKEARLCLNVLEESVYKEALLALTDYLDDCLNKCL